MNRPRLSNGLNSLVSSLKSNENRVLVVGDLHAPFTLKGYLEFCKKQYEEYNCNQVVFIGDVVDNHYSSYHESDPDGHGGGHELRLAIFMLRRWHRAFPKAKVMIGNHDRLIMRKAKTSQIPEAWIKKYSEVLEVPGWEFLESYVLDDVLYIHGEGGSARTRMKKELHSVVQGHRHTELYVDYLVGKSFKIFGAQVGCGINWESYAMAYAKNFPKPAIGCAVILDNGKTPIIKSMPL